MATIPANVNWVEDVCWMNLVSVAQKQNQIYYVGGYSYLRSTSAPSRGGIPLANSHLYALDFSSSVDLEKNYSSLFTSVTRLPDLVPRISRGNFVWRESSLNLLGGAQTTFPIFLSNGSFSLLDRVPIGDALFTHNISNANTWTRNSPFDYGGTQNTPIGKAAKAFDELSDDGKGVLWFYGGGYWEDPVKVGMESKGPKLDMTTITSGNSTAPRGYLQGTMVWVDNGAKGWLVLLGGSFRGTVVSMRYVHVYDIATSTWYTQPTTADSDLFPADRIEACAVAATAPDRSSYNIYVHGGFSNGTTVVEGGLWILTLPTFHWIRSYIGLENKKAEHTCAKIHEKFMVVHRGVAVMGDSNCDEYAGLMIVDLVTLEWVTRIDVSGGDVVYSVPELVSRIVGGNGAGGATFNSPTNGFVDSPLYSVFNVTSTSPLNLNASTTTIPTSSTSSPSPVPKVVGGVLGGLVLIIIILSCILLFLRRRRKQLEQGVPPPELPAVPGGMREMAAREAPAMELPGGLWTVELPSDYGHREDGECMGKVENKVSLVAGAGDNHASTQTGTGGA
ncbi:hypothetical protein EV426DRAFT_430997 [Tirmania nivea]|nr:hypothetical protein EV426DRAFT_430997 [Tirmania nivea]